MLFCSNSVCITRALRNYFWGNVFPCFMSSGHSALHLGAHKVGPYSYPPMISVLSTPRGILSFFRSHTPLVTAHTGRVFSSVNEMWSLWGFFFPPSPVKLLILIADSGTAHLFHWLLCSNPASQALLSECTFVLDVLNHILWISIPKLVSISASVMRSML